MSAGTSLSFAYTIALRDGVSDEQTESFVDSLRCSQALKSCVVTRELHSSGKPHLHAYLEFVSGEHRGVFFTVDHLAELFGVTEHKEHAFLIKECRSVRGWIGYLLKTGVKPLYSTFSQDYLDDCKTSWDSLNKPSRTAKDPDLKLDAYADVLEAEMRKTDVTEDNFLIVYGKAFCSLLRSRTIRNAHFAAKNKEFITALKIDLKIRFGLSIDWDVTLLSQAYPSSSPGWV